MNYKVTGGTGRFEGASGKLAYTATMALIFRNASTNAPALLMLTGDIEGKVSVGP